MNMLMGPNGSGKSSVVSAIALGLGWHPGVLGRSKDVAEFIRYGRESATIEIVLRIERPLARLLEASGEHEPCSGDDEAISSSADFVGETLAGYVRIKRVIRLNPNKGTSLSEWSLDGKKCRYGNIKALTHNLNIQIDNLCQFLPQDKVAEFARLSASELLVETEKAAAEPAIHQMHQSLLAFRSEESRLEEQQRLSRQSLASLERQNEGLERIVQRHQEREALNARIALCKQKRPWLVYNAARQAYLECKERRDRAKKDLEARLGQDNPLKRDLEATKAALSRLDVDAKQENSGNYRQLKDSMRLLEDLGTESHSLRRNIQRMREERAKKREELESLRQQINQMERDLETTAPPPQAESIRADDLARLSEEIGRTEETLNGLESRKRAIQHEGRMLGSEIDHWGGRLRELEDVRLQKVRQLRAFSPDTHEAMLWLEANQSLFQHRIYGPICLELQVTDQQKARIIPACLNAATMLSFVTGSRADTDLFLQRVEDEKGLKVNVVMIEGSGEIPKPPFGKAEMAKLGFEGSALDFVEGPEPVLRAICEGGRLHQVMIGSEGVNHEQVAQAGIAKYVAGDFLYEVKRSRYNPNDVTTRSSRLRENGLMAGGADESHRQHYQREITLRRQRLQENQETMRGVLEEQTRLEQSMQESIQARSQIYALRKEAQAEWMAFKRKQDQLRINRSKAHRMASEIAESQTEEDRCKDERARPLFARQSREAVKLVDQLSHSYDRLLERMHSRLEWLAMRARCEALEEQLRLMEHEHQVYRLALQEANTQLVLARDQTKAALDEAQQSSNPDEAMQAAFESLPDDLEELDQLLASETARAHLLDGGSEEQSAAAIRDYQARLATIESTRGSLEQLEQRKSSLSRSIQAVREPWLEAVQSMTRRISERFSQHFSLLGCAGHVQLQEQGDELAAEEGGGGSDETKPCADRWQLNIMVRFRDGETMQRLTAHRQSGGEKSVSTMIYLLAMQELAKAPFRVVDEINQGMDAHNERRVHSLIVNVATQASKAQ